MAARVGIVTDSNAPLSAAAKYDEPERRIAGERAERAAGSTRPCRPACASEQDPAAVVTCR